MQVAFARVGCTTGICFRSDDSLNRACKFLTSWTVLVPFPDALLLGRRSVPPSQQDSDPADRLLSDRLSADADCALLRYPARLHLPTFRGSAPDGRAALVQPPSVCRAFARRRARGSAFSLPRSVADSVGCGCRWAC